VNPPEPLRVLSSSSLSPSPTSESIGVTAPVVIPPDTPVLDSEASGDDGALMVTVTVATLLVRPSAAVR
jgi:hypothetical protein